MPTTIVIPVVSMTLGGVAVKIKEGSVKLDAKAVPYATATVTIPLTSSTPDVDPRAGVRAIITATKPGGGTRTFNLGVRSRTLSHKAGTLTVTLASDEATLQGYSPLTPTSGARAYEGSLRGVINWALIGTGALAASPSNDADVTAMWQITNLVTNPSWESGTTGWVPGGNCATYVQDGVGGSASGAAHAKFTSSGVGNYYIDAADSITVSEGTKYTVSAYLRATTANREGRILIRWLKPSGGLIRSDLITQAPLSPGAWTRLSGTFTAPKGAASARVHLGMVAQGAGEIARADAVMFYEGDEVVPYFDGSKSTDSRYYYNWEDGTDSASTRVPIVERPPETFTWEPGVTAWEFLAPLIATAGLRLYCDEQRVWRLINPTTYVVGSTVDLTGAPLVEAEDTITIDDPEVSCTGVIVRYTWNDSKGNQRTRSDTAGAPGRVLILEVNGPYPGKGVAAAALARRAGKGRDQDVSIPQNWDLSPMQNATVSLPNASTVTRQIESVEWGLTDGLTGVGIDLV